MKYDSQTDKQPNRIGILEIKGKMPFTALISTIY
jgi:hypothetical protein